MKPNLKTVPYITAILFFISYFLFTLLYIDPRLIFTFNGLNKFSFVFEFSREYAASIAFVPGGFAKLCATLVVEACEHAWLGAFLLTLIAGGLTLGTAAFVSKIRQKPLFVLYYVPAILFLVMLSRYSMHYLPAVLSMLGSVILALVYQRISGESAIKRCALFSVFFLAAYYLFSFTAVLFGVLVIVHEFLVRKNKIFPVLYTAAVLAVVLFLFRLFVFPFDRIFTYASIVDFRRPLLYLFLAVPLSAFLAGLSPFSTVDFMKGKKKSDHERIAMVLYITRGIVVLMAVALTMTWAARDWTTKTLRELGSVIYCDRNCLWNDILQKKHSFLFRNSPNWQSPTTLLTAHALYRALYHTGRLGTDMLTFPQITDPEPLLLWKSSYSIYFPAWVAALESVMDLGMENFAERIAGEAMENMGPLPFLLFRRTIIQAVKGNDECAHVYLNKLKQMPGSGQIARRLENGTGAADLSSNPGVVRLRSFMDTCDYVINRADEEKALLNLLKSNPRNRMAFEYLMAYYLLSRRPDMVVHNLYRLDDLGYREIPMLYQEALEIYRQRDSTFNTPLAKLASDPYTKARCERFLKLMQLYDSQSRGSQAALVSEFGSSYFFFFTFGYSTGGKS
jgi:Family of unknown function (DUF6057)